MKSFKFKYSATVWLLLSLILALSIIGAAWNAFNLTQYSWSTFKVITYSLLTAMTAALAVFVLSVMISSKYVVKGEYLYTRFGFIFNKVKIEEIVEITHFKKSDKLVVYFSDAKYSVIVIPPENYGAFVIAIREVNKSAVYDVKIDGEDTPA